MRKKIANWIRNKVKEAKVEGIVMGLSGGIDSCVVAA
ncbi:MAG: NAD(+) synthetase, partial [Candidatus Omnitrophota bacterium]